jgi:5'-nucleotidase
MAFHFMFLSAKPRFLLISLLFCLITTGGLEAKQLTILYTGDTHAALYPCDCPLAPDGGIARRAAAIQQIREQVSNVLLLDSGGAFAGGVYDEHTKGKELDSARTRLYLEAMQQMGYDVLALGDEELGFGLDFMQRLSASSGINLVSANAVYKSTDNPVVAPYVVKEVDNLRTAIIGLTPPDAKSVMPFEDRDKLEIQAPPDSLKRTLAQIAKSQPVDLIIVLSHLGEKESRELLEQFPEIDILINGHRKDSLKMLQRVGTGFLLQFSFQGRRLGRLDITLSKQNEIIDYSFQSIRMSREIADDEAMLALLRNFNPQDKRGRVAVDLYVISDCPYCKDAEAVMRQVLLELEDKLEFGLHFIPPPSGEELDKEAQIQLLIRRYFPDEFWAYLDCRNQDIAGMPWERCAAKAGIDSPAIAKRLTEGQGEELLRLNQMQARRLHISTGPTLFINHKPYSGRIEGLALIKYICRQLPSPETAPACKRLPECLSDEDCRQPGMIGSCESAGTSRAKCSFQPAVAVPLTIVGNAAGLNPQAEPLNWLMRLFPGIKTEYVTADSPPGKRLIQDYQLDRLPAYLFAQAVLEAKNIDQLKPQLRFINDRLLLDPSLARAHFYINRTPRPGRIEFLFSPLSPQSNKILLDIYRILEEEKPPVDFGLRYLVRREAAGKFNAPGGQAELEEARRQLVIRRDYPAKFNAYIKLRNQQLASSYWEQPLLELGLDPYQIKQKAQSKAIEELLADDAAALEGLEIGPAPLFLVNNQELIELQNRQQFRELLASITHR